MIGIRRKQVSKDAKIFGLTQITEPSLSKYVRSAERTLEGAVTEYGLYFLIVRYGLELEIKIKDAKRTPEEIVKRLIMMFPEFEKELDANPKLMQEVIEKIELEQDLMTYKSDL